MRRLLIALLVLAVVGGLSWVGYQATAAEKEPPPPDYEIYTVGEGDIAATVTSTGSVEAAAEVNLVFRSSGAVAELNVQPGDQVTAGQVLARLDSQDLLLAQRQAEVGLRLAEARLAQAQKPVEALDLAAAEAGLESARAGLAAAQAGYQGLLAGATAAQRKSTEAAREQARVALEAAQAAYDQIAHLPNAGMLPQAVQLQQATIQYEVAKSNVDAALAPATASQRASALAQIAQAQAAVAQAQASVEKLKRGLSAEDLEILQAQVEQARISAEQAALALKNAQIVAPIAGVVGAVNVRANEIPTPGAAAIVLTDPSGYHIDLNVDEIDIGKLQLGQPADITIDALDNAQLTGRVSRIAPIAGSGNPLSGGGVVTYLVRVDLNASDLPLRSGLTATVAITTEEARKVVLLPNRVMRLDRQTGGTYVEKLVDGVPQRTDVEVGLRNEQFSQVLSGVAVGEQLAVRRTDTGEAIRQQFFGGGG